MKKLSLLIAMILCVTIGGVYATWTYSQGTAATRDAYLDDVTKITDKTVANAKGVISVDKTGLTITIDDANDDKVAECTIDGELVIKFKPNNGADDDVFENGVTLQYKLSVENTWKYNEVLIFNVDTNNVVLGAPTKTGSGQNVEFTWTISADELNSKIAFYTNDAGTGADGTLRLPTVTAYEAFKKALHNGSICALLTRRSPLHLETVAETSLPPSHLYSQP